MLLRERSANMTKITIFWIPTRIKWAVEVVRCIFFLNLQRKTLEPCASYLSATETFAEAPWRSLS